ncbi:MAG: DUF1127 domain-containing protein [Tateyamaria sp.]|uniref:DUF1127 domain-containing protein n=1 Tax=Tateyamaria sp. TaxID=1929288 RepID=UPI00329077B6
MAYASHTDTNVTHSILAGITGFFAAVGRGIMMSSSADARLRKAEILNAKTDEELAELGLRREDIPAFVFRDLMHL